MNANPQFLATAAHVDEAAVKPLPNSRKFYAPGSRPDIRVPMREITLTAHVRGGVVTFLFGRHDSVSRRSIRARARRR